MVFRSHVTWLLLDVSMNGLGVGGAGRLYWYGSAQHDGVFFDDLDGDGWKHYISDGIGEFVVCLILVVLMMMDGLKRTGWDGIGW